MKITTARVERCRYLDRMLNRCTGEIVEPDGEIYLCTRHLAAAAEMLHRKERELLALAS